MPSSETSIKFDVKGKGKDNDSDQDSLSSYTFASLGVSQALIRSLSHLSIHTPTPIQALTIPPILASSSAIASSSAAVPRDVIGGAQTGAGKTLCFALPILQGLYVDPVAGFALVLTPTRELAVQLHEQFLAVAQGVKHGGASMGLNCALVVGGVDQLRQASQLADSRPHVIVATPGRLVDILQSNAAAVGGLLSRCRFVVLDEADRLLTKSFAPQLQYLFNDVLPPAERRQTLLFTATLTEAIDALVKKGQEDAESALRRLPAGEARPKKGPPLVCKIEQPTTTPEMLIQRYILVPSHMREVHLFHLLKHSPAGRRIRAPSDATEADATADDSGDKNAAEDVFDDDAAQGQEEGYDSDDEDEVQSRLKATPTIIFVNRSLVAEQLSRLLTQLSIPNVSLHSLLPQSTRFANLHAFRAHRVPILVSTDVGSRGLDIPEVQCVVNFDVPANWEDYVHRVGRTARNGKSGWAVSFVTERDVELIQSIEAKIGVQLKELKGYTDTAGTQGRKKVGEERILEKLNKVMTAKRTAKLEMQDEKFGETRERNKRKAELAAAAASGNKKRKKAKLRKE
ncbi:DEAD-domain-containing protein [Tilletiaria anomala UBC 951]|uniref:DEAD-domain-containing protein n=1 Tax=Tilletiaria anomala (strain ATCC 24038 / CBS 436.72 / UBC 951) TaxID=1037660 RepID=A0A066VZG2_TILAU|nr:DEAD-domain-containing protein [Tilletiaria anomala UBC 951]KDN43905.1 DEAD-domain-containing protein [Tilletiaria anomala UBC 951]